MIPTVHANCVVVGEAGVLIRGVSGSGKSALSAALIERARAAGLFARLVADDRVRLEACNGRLLATVPDHVAGLIERRGLGVTAAHYLAEAVVRLVVEIEATPDRMPDEAALGCEVDGVALPRLAIALGAPECAALALFRLGEIVQGRGRDPSPLAFAPQHGNMPVAAPVSVDHPVRSRRSDARPLPGAQ